jgi:hypothetical protein
MRIGVIGSGRVGSALGEIWAGRGHEVTFGSREPTSDAMAELVARVPGAGAASLRDALASAEVVLLAVPGAAAEAVVRDLDGWAGKVILDATNRLDHGGESNAVAVQRAAPGAHVVKAFNVVGVEAMARAARGEATGTLPLAGNDDDAVASAARLAREAGFEPLHVGGLAMAASLERLAMVWIDWSRTLGRRFLWQVVR